MAKNFLERKKRIAHNTYDDVLNGNQVLPGCLDYVSSIIQNMDSNFKSVHLNKISAPQTKFMQQDNFEKNDDTPSTSQNHVLNTNGAKSKKFGLTRKYPLMEKSQKILQHLKHNRKIPKQRAHLASFKDDIVNDNSVKTTENRKNGKQEVKNLKKNNVLSQNKKTCNKPAQNVIASSSNKESSLSTSKISKKRIKTVGNKVDLNNLRKKYNFRRSYSSTDNLDNIVNDCSNDNTTDSEYENFIKKSKKGLVKKHNQKTSTSKRKVSKSSSRKVKGTASKTILKSPPSEHDSDCSDVVLSRKSRIKVSDKKRPSSHKVCNDSEEDRFNEDAYTRDPIISPSEHDSDFSDDVASHASRRKSKRLKISDKKHQSNSKVCTDIDSEEEMFNEDAYTRDSIISPSEQDSDFSDDVASNAFRSKRIKFSDNKKEQNNSKVCTDIDSEENMFDGEVYTRDSSSERDVLDMIDKEAYARDASSNSLVAGDENELNSTCDTHLIEQKDEERSSTFKTHSLSNGNNNASNSLISHELQTVNSGNNSICSAAKSDEILIKPYNQSENSMIVILSSDDESENVVSHVLPSIDLPKKLENCKRSNINSDSTMDSEESDVEILDVVLTNKSRIKGEFISPPALVETGKSQNIFKPNTELEKQQKKDTDKNQPAYITDICQKYEESDCKAAILNQSQSNKNVSNTSDKILSEDILNVTTALKKEVCDDDDIIILDSDSISYNDSKPIIENKSTEKELKLHEISCSNLKSQTVPSSEDLKKLLSTVNQLDMNNLPGVDIESLLQAYKSEFQSYQEIVQTEASVGATFKMLESRQAQKLLALKSALKTCLESNACDSHNIQTILQQDLQTPFSTVNRLSSSAEKDMKDIKPDFSVLQCINKSEPCRNISPEKNTMTFGEKCSVCSKDAVAACQRCAKVFFCSNECGLKYWKDGHEKECT